MSETAYQGARLISGKVERHFDYHLKKAESPGEDLAPKPEAAIIETIIDAAFWAGLRREEGRSPKISLAYLPPERSKQPLIFERRIPLLPKILTKLAPAVERSGIHLGVWHEQGELYIWGTTRSIPAGCFVLEVVEPGLLVIKHRRIGGFGKFVNVAILKGDEVKFVDENCPGLPEYPVLISSLLDFNHSLSGNDHINVLIQLAVSMRLHGRGGSLLVVPSTSRKWRESIVHPISYPVDPAYSELTELMRENAEEKETDKWQAALNRSIESIAGLTAVDGATIITDRHELLAFGAKIERAKTSVPVEKIIVTEPVVGNTPLVIHPVQHGGTRHLSAAQFIFDQRDALALIASQDGRFTIFGWSSSEGMVHAHQVDALLL